MLVVLLVEVKNPQNPKFSFVFSINSRNYGNDM